MKGKRKSNIPPPSGKGAAGFYKKIPKKTTKEGKKQSGV